MADEKKEKLKYQNVVDEVVKAARKMMDVIPGDDIERFDDNPSENKMSRVVSGLGPLQLAWQVFMGVHTLNSQAEQDQKPSLFGIPFGGAIPMPRPTPPVPQSKDNNKDDNAPNFDPGLLGDLLDQLVGDFRAGGAPAMVEFGDGVLTGLGWRPNRTGQGRVNPQTGAVESIILQGEFDKLVGPAHLIERMRTPPGADARIVSPGEPDFNLKNLLITSHGEIKDFPDEPDGGYKAIQSVKYTAYIAHSVAASPAAPKDPGQGA